jgi:hypothetical protein
MSQYVAPQHKGIQYEWRQSYDYTHSGSWQQMEVNGQCHTPLYPMVRAPSTTGQEPGLTPALFRI